MESVQDELVEEIHRDDTDTKDKIQTEEILDESIQEDVEEEYLDLTEEEVAIEVAEIEEVIDIPVLKKN